MSRASRQTVDVQVDERQLAELRELLADVPRGVPRVLSRAINQVGTAARTRIVRRVVAEVNLKSGEVKRRNITLRKANVRYPAAWIRISGSRIPLLQWGSRQTTKGVSYAIRRGQRKTAAGAFKESKGTPVRMPTGHEGVFVRTGAPRISRQLAERGNKRLGRRKGMAFLTRPRLPITERWGPSVPAVVAGIAELAASTLDREIAAKLRGEIETQVGLVLERHRKGLHG